MNDYDRNENNRMVYNLLSDLCSYSIEHGGKVSGDLFAWLFDNNSENAWAIDEWLRPEYYDYEQAGEALTEMYELDPYASIKETENTLNIQGEGLYKTTDIEDFIISPLTIDNIMDDLKLRLR